MSSASFYCPSMSCWRVPTRYCFASWGNIDALGTVHDAGVCPNDSGIDGMNEVLQLLISPIDRAGRKAPHQIPIACALI
jgi:hypothetical protein